MFFTAVAMSLSPAVASASTLVVYNDVPSGQAAFDSTVSAAGGTLSTQTLTATSNYADFTISKIPNFSYSEIVGALTDIAPFGSIRGPSGDSRASGISFNFSTAINSFGLNVGDWGTC